jgi:hypothetical protein
MLLYFYAQPLGMRTAQLYCNIELPAKLPKFRFLIIVSCYPRGIIVVYLTNSCVNCVFFGTRGPVISKKNPICIGNVNNRNK